jgi:4-amino-4-deoxy-L-arabinose transferase-like glycosyltransferase
MTRWPVSKLSGAALIVAFVAIWFYALGARTLVPTDEGRYAEMAREMAASGDWITPRLNGIKYFEKPPLQIWIGALTFRAFGLGEWQARLWTGLCGLFGIAMTAYAGRRLFNQRIGGNAGLVLASCFMWAAMAHVNTLDMGLAAMMALALCALLIAQQDEATPGERRNWMLACWTGMALAVLSKGPIGVILPGAVLVLYSLLERDRAIWKRLHAGAGLSLFLAIAAPWFILVSLQNPEFPRFFFLHEHVERFTSQVHRRTGAWYYFVPILLLGILPWLGVLPRSLWPSRRQTAQHFQPKRMLLIWAVFIFVFFSASGSKLPSYILPIAPALALLIACHLEQVSYRALALNAGLIALIGAAGLASAHKIPAFGTITFEHALYRAYQPWAIGAAATALIGGTLAALLARPQKQLSIALLAGTGFLAGQLLLLGHEPLGRYKAGLDHVPALAAELAPDTPIYAVRMYEQALPFYLRRTLVLVADPNEMEFGLQQEPQRWLPTVDAFLAQWSADCAAGRKALAVMQPEVWSELRRSGMPMRLIAQDPRRIIVANNPDK